RTYTSWGIPHQQSLTLLTTGLSVPAPTRAAGEAGLKSMSNTNSVPWPVGLPERADVRLSAEHAPMEFHQPHSLHVGARSASAAGYGDTTVHLHDTLYGVRQGMVEAAWPVAGRGKTR